LFLDLFSQLAASQPVFYGIISTLFITYSNPIGGYHIWRSFLDDHKEIISQ
jgi:hypothetical protein